MTKPAKPAPPSTSPTLTSAPDDQQPAPLPGMPPAPALLTTDEVASLLRIDVRTVRRWIGDGQVESVKVGAQYRVPRRSLERFLGTTIDQLAGA